MMDVYTSILGLSAALLTLITAIIEMRKALRNTAEPIDRESD